MKDSPVLRNDSPRSSNERREIPRFTFVATAELTDSASGMKLSGRVTQISRRGCYVDLLAAPMGTDLDVRISRDQVTFVTKGKTLYIHIEEEIGMGIAFLDPPEEQLQILDSWLAELPSSASL